MNDIGRDLLREKQEDFERAEILRILQDPDELMSALAAASDEDIRKLYEILGYLVVIDSTPIDKSDQQQSRQALEEVAAAIKNLGELMQSILENWMNEEPT